jgi:hypothetical protein
MAKRMLTKREKLVNPDGPDREALAQMVFRGESWFAYRNEDVGHPDMGRLAFLQCGVGCTYETPPAQYPDTAVTGFGWRYRLVGPVDLERGVEGPSVDRVVSGA